VDDEVGSVLDGAEQHRRGDGVVDHGASTVFMREVDERLQVEQLQQGIGELAAARLEALGQPPLRHLEHLVRHHEVPTVAAQSQQGW
jgi:hypothetical protein